jgi:hypothetical protein
MLGESDKVDPVLLVLILLPTLRFCQDVGGNDERPLGVLVLLLVERSKSLPSSSAHAGLSTECGEVVARIDETDG